MNSPSKSSENFPLRHGISHNRGQFFHQLFQVLLVGLTIGMTRTVVPALAESEFGVPKNSFVLLQPVSEEKGVRGSKEREKNKQ